MSGPMDAPETGSESGCAAPILVVGIGNEHRGDDAVGLLVARRLAERDLPGVTVREHDGETAGLMERWRGARAVILVDAVAADAASGSTFSLDAASQPVHTALFRCSTHAFGVAEAVELARALGELPPQVRIVGIVGENWEPGAALTPAIEEAMPAVERALLAVIDELRNPASGYQWRLS